MPVMETSQSRVHFDETKCRSSGRCSLSLPRIIQALSDETVTAHDGAEEMLKRAVAACPSGALSCSERRRGGAKLAARGKDQVRERRFYLP